MSDIAIKVENLSKLYQLGTIGTGTLRNDLHRWWANARGKENPLSKIGVLNDRSKKAESEFVWSLKDIDFEVKKGEVLGIIGRNGAGKSTLLKILSKITSPTTGKINVNGRIASLLEVGTGFHPELTGRENIFMNGAILGMRKWEIQKKFDAIVDFSGVEGYIDTPVKRYSSGMYVRLAFAVAAFLEPEILIVDEVLAVGDAEFQKRCLGRMKDVSINDGRTVLFVSHNMDAIKTLCSNSVVLKNGLLEYIGETNNALRLYNRYQIKEIPNYYEAVDQRESPFFKKIQIFTGNENLVYFSSKLNIEITVCLNEPVKDLELSFQIFDVANNPIVYNWLTSSKGLESLVGRKGNYKISIVIPNLRLYKGEYYLGFNLTNPKTKSIYDRVEKVFHFSINMGNITNDWGWQDDACRYLEIIECSVNKMV